MTRLPHRAAPRLESTRLALVLGAVLMVGIAVLSAWARVHAALGDPNFDATQAEGMLKSDPALLYYFVERILEAGGGLPADFHADPRILHPGTVDVPALFPLGMEFVVAWARELTGSTEPLHVFCLEVTSVLASLAVIGVYGLALELTRRVGWALVAAAAYATMWANYRTVGFILVGEDFSVPWFALHLYLLARAVRLRTKGSIVLAALAWIAGLATWHATSFFVSIEAALVFAWFLRTGSNPVAVRGAWTFLALSLGLACVVPILWSTRFAGSLPMALSFGLAAAAWASSRGQLRNTGQKLVAVGAVVLVLALSIAVSRVFGGGLGEYSHVWGLLAQKLAHLGAIPADPAEIPAEVRLMWQGPFATANVGDIVVQLGFALLALPWVLHRSVRGFWRGDDASPAIVILGAGLIAGLACAWLITRTLILPGLLLPVAFAVVGAELSARCASAGRRQLVALGVAAVLLVQAADVADRVRSFQSSWYEPPQRQQEIRALVRAIPTLVPKGEAIASDFMVSTAILAHTRHPMLLQPKYEDRESRARAVEYFATLYHGTPADLRRLLLERYHCRYVVLDRYTIGMAASRYLGGLRRDDAPIPGSWWDLLARPSPPVLPDVPGYRLLYRSPISIRGEDGSAWDAMRVYELSP